MMVILLEESVRHKQHFKPALNTSPDGSERYSSELPQASFMITSDNGINQQTHRITSSGPS
jgi:hypothetical protein